VATSGVITAASGDVLTVRNTTTAALESDDFHVF
jgi:hypothetical protein